MSGEFLKHKSKILLIGGSGTLGLAILKSNFFNKQIISPKKKNLNLLNKKQIKKYLNQNFDIILNCSGFSRIRICEKNKSKSFKLNVKTTKNLVNEINFQKKKNNKIIKLIQISSDAVYSSLNGKYKETSKCNPKTYYGYCKLRSENICKKLSNFLIIRTRFFDKKKFIYNDAATDIYSSMIEVNELVKLIYLLLKKNINGIINVGGKRNSDYNIIRKYKKSIKKTSRKLILKESKIFITKDSSMDLKKLNKIIC